MAASPATTSSSTATGPPPPSASSSSTTTTPSPARMQDREPAFVEGMKLGHAVKSPSQQPLIVASKTADAGTAGTPRLVTASSNSQPWWDRFFINCGCCVVKPYHVVRAMFVFFIVFVLVGLGLWIWDQYFDKGTERHVLAWAVGAVFAALATAISMLTIFQHMTHYSRPELQRYVIRILWMVPIYAVESYLSVRFKEAALYLETAREWYEAYVIYCFLYLLLFYCAGSDDLRVFQENLARRDQHDAHHLFPFKYFLPQWQMGAPFLRNCRRGVLQYVVIRGTCTAITFILAFFDKFCEGEITKFDCGYVYILIIINFSQIWAMYCLVLFYHACLKDLQPFRPFPKFISIKAVVFFTFWQGVIVAGAVHANVIKATQTYTVGEIARGFQDLLIVVEMFVVAVAHHWVFTYEDIADVPTDMGSCLRALHQSTLPTDVVRDATTAGAHHTPHAAKPEDHPV